MAICFRTNRRLFKANSRERGPSKPVHHRNSTKRAAFSYRNLGLRPRGIGRNVFAGRGLRVHYVKAADGIVDGRGKLRRQHSRLNRSHATDTAQTAFGGMTFVRMRTTGFFLRPMRARGHNFHVHARRTRHHGRLFHGHRGRSHRHTQRTVANGHRHDKQDG